MKKSLCLLPVLLCVTAFAQNSISVADSSSSGTYKKMLGEIIGVCSNESFSINEVSGITGGAPANLEALVNNKAQAAFLHSDVFFANSQADPSYNKFATLVALYPEPIHVLALRTSKSKKVGTFSFGTQDFNSLADMRGYTVGAAGGGVITARILQGQGQGGFNVQQFNSGDDVINALNEGVIAGAIFVGAAPLPNIERLDGSKYKLLPIGENIANRVQNVYRPTNVNYSGLTSGPMRTIAPVAVLLTRRFTTENRIAAQRHFRDCFNKNLPELKDAGSSNWQSVEAGDHGTLNNWLELPSK